LVKKEEEKKDEKKEEGEEGGGVKSCDGCALVHPTRDAFVSARPTGDSAIINLDIY
jgi:Zn-finger protein